MPKKTDPENKVLVLVIAGFDEKPNRPGKEILKFLCFEDPETPIGKWSNVLFWWGRPTGPTIEDPEGIYGERSDYIKVQKYPIQLGDCEEFRLEYDFSHETEDIRASEVIVKNA